VVNTAGYTDVDGAEADEAAATIVNGHAVELLASACAESGARLTQLSTDYVFPGDGAVPYSEDALTAPVNAYGRSKLIGEQAVLRTLPDTGYVVRTAWLYGVHGRNFVATMLRLATERDTVDVVDDQRGQPTWTVALARQIAALGAAVDAPAGIYHGTASGETTWYGLARAVFEAAGHDPDRVRPTSSDRYPRPARRPAYSVLDHDRWKLAGIAPQPAWVDSLRDALNTWESR
ncbi:MAG: dTDP-4-dehydrorhamnose reductase, partial [Micromonosporaceae bacterium]